MGHFPPVYTGFVIVVGNSEASKGTILVVEDNPDDVEIILLGYTRLSVDFHIVVLNDGREAMRYLAGMGDYANRKLFPKPCLLILDLKLPQMNGFELLTWMQGEDPGTMPAAIIYSSSNEEHDKRLAKKFGARDYFIKSPDLEETVMLLRKIFSWLAGAGGICSAIPP
jgi:two-component system response regulator